MKIELYANDLFDTLEDLRMIISAKEEDPVTIEAKANEGRDVITVLGFSSAGNFAEIKIRGRAVERGVASFRLCEIAQAAFAYHRSNIAISTRPDGTGVNISYFDSVMTLRTVVDLHRVVRSGSADERASFDSRDLLEVVSDVLHARSDDDVCRRSLCGVKIEIGADMQLRAIATNGRCLAVSHRQVKRAELKKPEFEIFLPNDACEFLVRVPHQAMTTLVKFGDDPRVGIEALDSAGSFITSEAFPLWRKCLPGDPPWLCTFTCYELENTLELAVKALDHKELVQADEDDPDSETTPEEVRLVAQLYHAADSDHINLTVNNPEDAEQPTFFKMVKCAAPSGVAFNTHIDARYLLQALRIMRGEVRMSAGKLNNKSEQLGPHLFKSSEHPEFFEVIMPLRD